MYEQDLALANLLGLICHKTQSIIQPNTNKFQTDLSI